MSDKGMHLVGRKPTKSNKKKKGRRGGVHLSEECWAAIDVLVKKRRAGNISHAVERAIWTGWAEDLKELGVEIPYEK